MEEANKIEQLASEANESSQGTDAAFRSFTTWRFTREFNECCAQDLKELRTEILRRLGPPAKDPDEISAWTLLFPDVKYQEPANTVHQRPVSPRSVIDYAPYLRRLGLRLKRRTTPRSAPRALHFSEEPIAPDKRNMAYNIMVTIKTETTVSVGYILVEFDARLVSAGTDLADSRLVIWPARDTKLIDNTDLTDYLKKCELATYYALAIGRTPFTSENPVHVSASGTVPLHAAKVILFDE